MRIVSEHISIDELKEMSKKMHHNLVKVVVDIERNIMAIDAEMHADEEVLLLKDGSYQENLWGVNLYPYETNEKFIEFYSIINFRPYFGNNSRGIDDINTQKRIKTIVNALIKS